MLCSDTLISGLEDEMKNGLNEMESLLNTMTGSGCSDTAQPASSWLV